MQHFDNRTTKNTNGYIIPKHALTKKNVPKVAIGKAKNHVLWEEEVKLGEVNENAYTYDPSFSQVEKKAKGGKNILGFDKKVTAKKIEITPGP